MTSFSNNKDSNSIFQAERSKSLFSSSKHEHGIGEVGLKWASPGSDTYKQVTFRSYGSGSEPPWPGRTKTARQIQIWAFSSRKWKDFIALNWVYL